MVEVSMLVLLTRLLIIFLHLLITLGFQTSTILFLISIIGFKSFAVRKVRTLDRYAFALEHALKMWQQADDIIKLFQRKGDALVRSSAEPFHPIRW